MRYFIWGWRRGNPAGAMNKHKRNGCHDLNFPCTTMIFNWTHSHQLNLKQTYLFANVVEGWGFFCLF